MLDCIFSHSHSNPLAGHRSSYMSSILIKSILSSGNDVTRYGIGAINVRFVASLAHAFSVVAGCVFLAVYGLSHISCESQMFPCAATPSLGGGGGENFNYVTAISRVTTERSGFSPKQFPSRRVPRFRDRGTNHNDA